MDIGSITGKMIRCHICLMEKDNLEQVVFCLEGDNGEIDICMQCIIDSIKWACEKRKVDSLRKKNLWGRFLNLI